ncbi:MAG: helix-turn-helix domain-containing protein, partial [Acidobacteria bacterium]|nr:helix-turn-helix domain-containing protein [Acidobacteriota bacterium]
MKTRVKNRLAEIRKSRGVGATDLSRRVHVSRQTIYAIEAGTYVPNTEVALNLARELEVTVEELFSLPTVSENAHESLVADVLSAAAPTKGQPVRICLVGPRWVSVPVSASPYYLPEADGIIKRPGRTTGRADLVVFAKEEQTIQRRLVVAGCDPATGLLSRIVEKATGVEVVSAAASSKLALIWLSEGKVHIAGSHLEGPKTGEFN